MGGKMEQEQLNISDNVEVGGRKGKSENSLKKWDLAVWIAPVPILGYGITFSFEFGVSIFYKYPTSFISLDPTLIAKNSILLLLLSIGIFIMPEMYHKNFKFILSKIQYIIQNKVLSEKVNIEVSHKSIIFLITISVMNALILLNVLKPILNFSDPFSIFFYLDFLFLSLASMFLAGIFYWIYRLVFINKNYILGVPNLLIVLIILPGVLGYVDAVSKETHYIIEGKKETYVVLNFVKDKLLIAPVDLKNKSITPEYLLIEAKTDFEPKNDKKEEQLIFNLVKTGPLSIEEIKTVRDLLESKD